MHEQLTVIVSGRVQMVMYRDFVQRKASGLSLTGYVQNLPDGTVQVVAEGPRVKLASLLEKLHKGSLLSHVEQVTPEWKTATGTYSSFTISY